MSLFSISPFLQIILGDKEFNQFRPPNSSDDHYLFFCINPSSIGECLPDGASAVYQHLVYSECIAYSRTGHFGVPTLCIAYNSAGHVSAPASSGIQQWRACQCTGIMWHTVVQDIPVAVPPGLLYFVICPARLCHQSC